MPQMSPLLWFNLYIYFLFTLIMIMVLLYYLNLFILLTNKINTKLNIKYKKLW